MAPNVNFVTTNPAQLNDRVTELQTALQLDEANLLQFAVYTAAGAITPGGNVVLKAGSAAAMTLALPIAGSQLNGGQDGGEMCITTDDAFAYTVTTPANGYNGATHVATFTAAVGNAFFLLPYNGTWIVTSKQGVALS